VYLNKRIIFKHQDFYTQHLGIKRKNQLSVGQTNRYALAAAIQQIDINAAQRPTDQVAQHLQL